MFQQKYKRFFDKTNFYRFFVETFVSLTKQRCDSTNIINSSNLSCRKVERICLILKLLSMATNPPKNNSRKGMVKERSQIQNPVTGLWTKRDTETGRFIDVKTSSLEPFKGVKKEK